MELIYFCCYRKREMMKLIRPLIFSGLQIVIMVAIYSLFILVLKRLGYTSRPDIAWGISLQIGLWVFCILVLLLNYLLILDRVVKYKLLLVLSFMLLFIFLFANDLRYTPYKTGLFLFCVLVGFLSWYPLDRIWRVTFSNKGHT